MRLRLLIKVVVAGLAASVSADTIDDFVRAEMERQRIPGLSLAVVREGKLVRSEGYGLANLALESEGRTWLWRFHLNEAGRVVDLAAEER